MRFPQWVWGASQVTQTVESARNVGHPGLNPGSGRSPGERNGTPLQYSCLENSMDGGALWATVHGVTKSWTGLSDFIFTFTFNESIQHIKVFKVAKKRQAQIAFKIEIYWKSTWESRKRKSHLLTTWPLLSPRFSNPVHSQASMEHYLRTS